MVNDLPKTEGANPVPASPGERANLPGCDGATPTAHPGSFSSKWPEEKISILTFLWNNGYSANEIGKRMGVSKNSVIGQAHRRGLPKRNSPLYTSKKPIPEKLLTLADLGSDQCRYPLGGPKERAEYFCGKPTGGGSWCSEHRKIVFHKPGQVGAVFHLPNLTTLDR